MRCPDWLLIGIGSVGRWLYEWADRALERGDPDVLRHAIRRLGR